MKNKVLEQTQKVLAQSNTAVIDFELWKQAKSFTELKKLLNTSETISISDTYCDLIEFDRQLADKNFEGVLNESRESQIFHC